MPVLKNSRWERFAQCRAEGMQIDPAYVKTGYKSNPGNAGRLNNNEQVRARIEELQGSGADQIADVRDLARKHTAVAVETLSHQPRHQSYEHDRFPICGVLGFTKEPREKRNAVQCGPVWRSTSTRPSSAGSRRASTFWAITSARTGFLYPPPDGSRRPINNPSSRPAG